MTPEVHPSLPYTCVHTRTHALQHMCMDIHTRKKKETIKDSEFKPLGWPGPCTLRGLHAKACSDCSVPRSGCVVKSWQRPQRSLDFRSTRTTGPVNIALLAQTDQGCQEPRGSQIGAGSALPPFPSTSKSGQDSSGEVRMRMVTRAGGTGLSFLAHPPRPLPGSHRASEGPSPPCSQSILGVALSCPSSCPHVRSRPQIWS